MQRVSQRPGEDPGFDTAGREMNLSRNRYDSRLCVVSVLVLEGVLACHRRRSTPVEVRSSRSLAAEPGAPVARRGRPAADAAPDSSGARDAAPDAPVLDGAAFEGGNWVKCYEHFRLGTRPKVDLMKLGMLCGPSNGMRRLTKLGVKPLKGRVGSLLTWFGHRGECYRVFAIASPGTSRVSIQVEGPGHQRLVEISSARRWVVAGPRGPFCSERAGRYRARIRVDHTKARPEAAVWRLP